MNNMWYNNSVKAVDCQLLVNGARCKKCSDVRSVLRVKLYRLAISQTNNAAIDISLDPR